MQSCTSLTEDSQTKPLLTQTVPTQSSSPKDRPSPEKSTELQLVMTIDADKGWSNIAFSPDGKSIASGNNSFSNNTDIWDVATGKKIRALGGHPAAILSVTFSPDGKILASTGALTQEVVNSVVFSPNGKILASGSYDGTIKIWRLP